MTGRAGVLPECWPDAGVDFTGWTVRFDGREGFVTGRSRTWRGWRWRITFDAHDSLLSTLPSPRVELWHPPAFRSVYLGSWCGDGRDYTGWTARALDGEHVPAGTVGTVIGAERQDGELVHSVDFRPWMGLRVPLPWPGIELIELR